MVHKIPIDGILDLHVFSPRDVESVVKEYVTVAAEQGFAEIRLIHGRGIGIQRRIVHSVLKKHPSVNSFWDAEDSHLGATIAKLLHGPMKREVTN
tara:strand:+ start:3635 stop:3919 length:285 start_codon:yes stop_codon:yes gene_type:complete